MLLLSSQPSASSSQHEVGLAVFHHYVNPVFPPSLVYFHTAVIGTYSSLSLAQTAVRNALEASLKIYEQAGLQGNVARAIELVYQGFITRIDRYDIEHPLSEFEIRPTHVWNDGLVLRMGDKEQQNLLPTLDEGNSKDPLVKMPPNKLCVIPREVRGDIQ